MHTHGADSGREHSHGGSAPGLGWELLDSIVLGAVCVLAVMLSEIAIKAWRDRRAGVRYDLTPEGRAATLPDPHPHSGVRVDTDELD